MNAINYINARQQQKRYKLQELSYSVETAIFVLTGRSLY